MFEKAKWITLPESELSKWNIFQGKLNNRFAVQVLACDSYIVNNMMENGQQPLIAYAGLPLGHRLAVEGCFKDADGNTFPDAAKQPELWGNGHHHQT